MAPPPPPQINPHILATAHFRLCHKPHSPPIPYLLSLAISPTHTELAILAALGANGRTHFCTFHEEREACVFARPLSDLVSVWHPEKIEGVGVFCLHLHGRGRRLGDEEVGEREREWAGGDGEGGGDQANAAASERVAVLKDGAEPRARKAKDQVAQRKAVTAGLVEKCDATMRLRFLLDEEASALDPAVWRGVDIAVPLSARVDSIPALVTAEMRKLVARDRPLFAMLKDASSRLGSKPSLHFKDYRDCYADFEHGKVLVETIAGLLTEPAAKGRKQKINLMVEVMGYEAETASRNSDEAVEPFVVNVAEMFRLGKIRDGASSSSKAGNVPYEMAVLGVLDPETGLRLGTVPIFSVNNLLIGDCYAGTGIEFKDSYAWAGKYKDVKKVEQLTALVRAHRHDELEADLQLPIRPSYSFRRLNALEHGLGLMRWPSFGVQLTVRCVNMLPESEVIVFPALKHTRYEIEKADTVDSVTTLIREETRAQGKDGRTCGSLFRGEMEGRWDLILWALPQIDGTATLYRWLEGGATQFLRPGRGGRDGRLYVEAHVVETEEAVGGRASAAGEMERQSEGLFVS